jgi:hypothetical protein
MMRARCQSSVACYSNSLRLVHALWRLVAYAAPAQDGPAAGEWWREEREHPDQQRRCPCGSRPTSGGANSQPRLGQVPPPWPAEAAPAAQRSATLHMHTIRNYMT